MGHFTLADWVDFIRNLKNPAAKTEMQRHLDEGCRDCQHVVRAWRSLAAFAANEGLCSPPDHAVRSLRGYYSFFKPRGQRARTPVMAHLLFDSFFEALPAGIRSSQSAPRHLMYSAGQLLIELRVEHRSGRLCIVGQARQRSECEPRVAERGVYILEGARKVARTTSNRFGEFQLEFESEENAAFSTLLKGPTSVLIPLRSVGQPQKGPSTPDAKR
jgi:hypothetical protein